MGQALSAASTGFTMLGSYVSSRAEAGADVYKSELLQQQAQYGELKATQTNAQKTRQLATTLGHIDAVRASAHADPTSPTGAAVRGEAEYVGEEKKNISVENIMQQARTDEANAAYMRSQSNNALLSGDISMLAEGFKGAAGLFPGGGGGGGTPSPVEGGGSTFFSPF